MKIVSPKKAGLSAARLAEIRATLRDLVTQGKIAGMSALVALGDHVALFEQVGQLDVAAQKPVRPDSIFRIYSLTKPVTSVAVLTLVEEGRLQLGQPVAGYLPELSGLSVLQPAPGDPNRLVEPAMALRIWHLLTHTGGLCLGLEEDSPAEEMVRQARLKGRADTLRLPLSETVSRLARLPLASHPGAAWRYSFAYDLLGYLLERVTGQSFADLLQERIFGPLDMTDTGFYVPGDKIERFGPLYGRPDERGFPEVDPVEGSPFTSSQAVPSGGVGLVSTMADYLRFMRMLLNGGVLDGRRLLQERTVWLMRANHLDEELMPIPFRAGMGYGLGLGVQVSDRSQDGFPPGTFGWQGISGTYAWVDPASGLIVISMPQAYYYWKPAETMQRLAYAALQEGQGG